MLRPAAVLGLVLAMRRRPRGFPGFPEEVSSGGLKMIRPAVGLDRDLLFLGVVIGVVVEVGDA